MHKIKKTNFQIDQTLPSDPPTHLAGPRRKRCNYLIPTNLLICSTKFHFLHTHFDEVVFSDTIIFSDAIISSDTIIFSNTLIFNDTFFYWCHHFCDTTRDVLGGEFSLGAGRGGAKKKIFRAGRGKKARKLTDLQNSTKTRKWKICIWIAFLAPKHHPKIKRLFFYSC